MYLCVMAAEALPCWIGRFLQEVRLMNSTKYTSSLAVTGTTKGSSLKMHIPSSMLP